eukprot:TRINITY_DN4055_c0_g1_i1.p3 TRINITY_DN4055_c0_g1~~TRINITY_DN4055_c0_g1_i1.p3  ORF type:complete len:102 (-),score=23.69 TRINITY_DN4055_c0_g1_i1:297-602(-)
MVFPGPKCAQCYTIFSAWGVLTLVVIGVLLDSGYDKIDNGELTGGAVDAEQEHAALQAAAKSSFIAAAIYGGCFIFCLSRVICLRFTTKPKERFIISDDDA